MDQFLRQFGTKRNPLYLGEGSQDSFASGRRAAGDGENLQSLDLLGIAASFGYATGSSPDFCTREITHRPPLKPFQTYCSFNCLPILSLQPVFAISVMTSFSVTGRCHLAHAEATAASNGFANSSKEAVRTASLTTPRGNLICSTSVAFSSASRAARCDAHPPLNFRDSGSVFGGILIA